MEKNLGKSALVIGGSLAGLLAARVLSNHFENVTIIERDPVHNLPESRKGQPQTRHLHGLLVEGLKIITGYFPDLLEGLQTDGIPIMDMAQTMQWYCYGGYRANFEFGMKGVITSRPFLEWQIRKRVLDLPNVTLKDGYSVQKLIASENNKQITGVQLIKTGQETAPETLLADLIVDASGRGSRTPKWLEELGYKKPPESIVTCGVGYATRLFERKETQPENLKWIFITPQAPRQRRAGGVFPVEGNRWMVGLAGWHGDHAPTDEEGFNAFAKSLPAPDVYNIITHNKPLSDIISYKFPASLRHHYEKMDHFPDRYLVLGDAACSFNPFYGQGMTSAAMQALALETLLQTNNTLDGLAKPYFKKVAKIVDIPWQTAVGEDFRFPETKGKKAPGTNLINAYIDRVHKATHHDTVVGAAFLKVMNMLEPPTSLLSPRILWRVAKHSLQKN
ncbi:FAD-dependent monooxygenase [Rhodocytophaga rosea]|uniref:FAD-dependent monooxygenase n=1 Tax=Rhodocytophaga rosea TaxID=2704465 RepID=A0A6C0GPY8_9BACT|nr:FAD-dependent monooxygenase [Rhodocytophaga rosea]QHT69652.1 FAD-dependent monooxygenase [Rhodocytophaga rosea]